MDNTPNDAMDVEHQTEENNVVAKNISFYIFLTIRTAQLQHGLRHGDYERYRYSTDLACFVDLPVFSKYCTARLQRLRRKLGIASKRTLKGGKPVPRTTDLSTLKDPR